MDKQKYLLEKKKINFTEKFIKKGLNAASYILFSLKEQGKLLLGELPSSYPQFKLLKEVFGVKEGDLNLTRKRTNFKENTIRVNLSRLKKQGLIRQELKKKIYVLTEEGKDLISYIGDRYSILNKPWDKKLRIVIFDIPEKKKYWREWIRQQLLLLQFQQLQKSVYIGKYPLPESFYQEIIDAELNKNIFVFTANEIDKKKIILEMLKEPQKEKSNSGN